MRRLLPLSVLIEAFIPKRIRFRIKFNQNYPNWPYEMKKTNYEL